MNACICVGMCICEYILVYMYIYICMYMYINNKSYTVGNFVINNEPGK